MTNSIFWRGLDEAVDVLHSDHRHRLIYAADDVAQESFSTPLITIDDLQGLRLQLVALLGKSLHNLLARGWHVPDGFMRYMQHRKRYKNVPTDKCG